MSSSLPPIRIEIPSDAEPGDTLTFQLKNGQNLELIIPEGSSPGDVLELQVGQDGKDQTQDITSQDDHTVLALPNGKELKLYSKLPPTMQGSASASNAASSTSCYDDETHALPWPAGIELAKALFQIQLKDFSNVLELGSGLGAVGLAAACCCCLDDGSSTRFLLTDCAAAMPLLEYNIQQNKGSITDHVAVEIQTLEWSTVVQAGSSRSGESDHGGQDIDLILGADLLYNPEMIPALVDTLERHFKPASAIILAVRWRKPDIERSFFEQTEKRLGLHWRPNDSSSLPCQLSWKDVGKSVEFQHYYKSTLVGVNGTPKSLQSIEEQDLAEMSNAEHEAWERAHIQIYVGTTTAAKGRDVQCGLNNMYSLS